MIQPAVSQEALNALAEFQAYAATKLLVLDLIGTFVFALSGAVAGVRERLDLFGVLVLSFAAASAGGIMRDLLIGAVPPAAISDWRYLAAQDGVDVRLLVPNGTDIPLLRPLSRAGYRPLLEAGVRVFEWNGTMLHAKTAVADGHWARVGSTNLNIASWFGNCEVDAVVEDEAFARLMEETYLHDLDNSTEVVLDAEHKIHAPNEPPHPHQMMSSGGGSGGRAAAGAIRLGNAIGAAFTNRRVLEPVEAHLMVTTGVLLLVLAIVFWFFPRVLVYPLAIVFVWIALALFYKAHKLHRESNWRGFNKS